MDDGPTDVDEGGGGPRRGLLIGGVVLAVVLVVLAIIAFSGGSSDDDAAKDGKTTTTAPDGKGTTTTLPKRVVFPERDVEVLSCGKAPKVRVTNSTKKASSYLVVVKAEAADDDEVGQAAGRVQDLAPGQSEEVELQVTTPFPDDAACTVDQVVRSAL